VDVELHLIARVSSHVDNPGVHTNCIFGTHFDAIAAIDADPKIDVESDRILLDTGIRMLTSHDCDASRRADRLTEHASDTARAAVVTQGKPVAASESKRERPQLFRVLKGDRASEVFEESQAVHRVKKKVPEKVLARDPETAGDLRKIKLFPKRRVAPAEHFDSHGD
jgi:hypothetical protein